MSLSRARGLSFQHSISPKKFLKAVSKGDVATIKKALKTSVAITDVYASGRNALHIAALDGQEQSVRCLIELGMDPALNDDLQSTPLHGACSRGHCDIAELLLYAYESRNVLYKKINQPDINKFTPLHLACMSSNESLIRALITHGADAEIVDGYGQTALDICKVKKDNNLITTLLDSVDRRNRKMKEKIWDLSSSIKDDSVEELVKSLQEGIRINTKTDQQQSLLYIAACAGAVDCAHCLVGRGADINSTNSSKRSIIHQLVLEGHEYMFDFFINLPKIDLFSVDCTGTSIIHCATQWGRSSFTSSLIKKDKELLNVKDKDGCSPLHYSAKYGKVSTAKVLLEEFNVNPNITDNQNRTPLHYASQWKRLRILKYLLNNNADVNWIDSEGESPLHLSCRQFKYFPVLETLLEHNANPSIQNNEKNTPLHLLLKWKRPQLQDTTEGCLLEYVGGTYIERPLYSADYNAHTNMCYALIRKLKDNDMSLDIQDKEDRTPLHWAIVNRHKDIAVILIEEGASTEIKDVHQKNPFAICEQSLYPSDIRQELLAALEKRNMVIKKQNINNLHQNIFECASLGDYQQLDDILKDNDNVQDILSSLLNDEGQTILHIASNFGHNNFCTHLFEKYQYPRMLVHKKDNQQLTALHLAASNGHPSVCNLLIQFGADLFLTNEEGLTPLQMTNSDEVKEILSEAETKTRTKQLFTALDSMDTELSLSLIKQGIIINAVDEYGCTPLIVACIQGFSDITEELLKLGSDITAIDENYQNSLHWAAMKGNKECIKILLSNNVQLNSLDIMEQTPLHWAIIKEQQESSILLAKAGADLNIKNGDGKTPLDLATKELADMLINVNSIGEVGIIDVEECNRKLFALLENPEATSSLVSELLDEGAELEALGEYNSTPLCAASITGLYDVVKLLISKNCNIEPLDESNLTPLHWAAIKGNCSVGQLLIESKANPNISDDSLKTPLHYAVLKKHNEFAKLLIRSSADVSIMDCDNQTPIDLANEESKDAILALCKQKEEPKTENNNEDIEYADEIDDTEEYQAPNPQKELLNQVIGDSVSNMIREAVKSTDLSSQCKNTDNAEEIITAVVDSIINSVQNRAETLIDSTFKILESQTKNEQEETSISEQEDTSC